MRELIALLVALLSPPAAHRTVATRYADTARDEGGTPACWRRCLRAGPGGGCATRFPDRTFGDMHPHRCAHRTLPCGTVLAVRRVGTPRIALCAVLDRGPWGTAPAVPGDPRRPAPAAPGASPRVYRGDLDLSPGVADRLGLRLHCWSGRRGTADRRRAADCADGRARVEWWVVAGRQ